MLRVDERVAKPMFTPCPEQCEQGCAIYAERPAECAAYTCAWLRGHFWEQHRPDRLGVLFDFIRHGGGELRTLEYARALEARPGALDDPRGPANRLLDQLAERIAVHVQRYDRQGDRWGGPPEDVQELMRRMR